MSIKFVGTLLILTLAPGGGGGINKREQAQRATSSLSSISVITGCTDVMNAVTYLFASVFDSSVLWPFRPMQILG